MRISSLTILYICFLTIFSYGLKAQNWSENFENYPIRDSSFKYGYGWAAASIGTGGIAISGRSCITSPLNNPLSPASMTTGYFAMTSTTYNISFQTKLTNTSSSPVLTVSLVDMTGTEVAIVYTYAYPGSGLTTLNFSFTGLNGWYRLRFKFTGSGGGSRATIDNITSDIPAIALTGSSTRLSDIQTTVQITGTDCNSQTITVRFTNLGPDPAFAYGNMGMATLQNLTGINYTSYTTSPNLRLDPLTNTLYFFETFSTTGLPVNQYLELIITMNTPNNCSVSLGSTFQWFSLQTDHLLANNTDYKDISFAILPASLSPLSISRLNDKVNISWTAYNEINVSHYIIEKSENGNTFYTVGSVKAKGKGEASVHYSFQDILQQEKNYFRVILVDVDGKTKTSQTVVVNNTVKENGFSLYPNPSGKSGALNIISNVTGNILLELIETGGKVLSARKINNLSRNTIPFTLPANIKNGQYWIRMSTNGQLIGIRPLMIVD